MTTTRQHVDNAPICRMEGRAPSRPSAICGHDRAWPSKLGHYQLIGAVLLAILIPSAIWAQDRTATNQFSPSATSNTTNAPAAPSLTAPQPVQAFQPTQRQITVPQAAQIEIPLATAPAPP